MREEAEEAQDAQVILGNTHRGIADETHRPAVDIGQSADEIDDVAVCIDVERVHGQVAAFRIGLPVGGKGHLRMPAVGLDVAPQRRHLERRPIDDQRHRAVRQPGRHRLDAGSGSALHHRFRPQRRGDVDIAHGNTQQAVAHRATDHPAHGAVAVQQRQHPRQGGIAKPVLASKIGHA